MIASVSNLQAQDWVEVFGERDARDRVRLDRQAREASLAGDHRAEAARTHAALMNFGAQARTGTETHLNARADSTAAYIHHLHSYIHPEWEAYLMRLEVTLGPGSVMADPNLHTRLEWVIAADGHVRDVAVVQSSGQALFDMEAINLLYRLDPVRPPPVELRSPNGNTYVHWSFRRDQRMCFTGGAAVRFIGATEFADEDATAPL
jgi:TonB family protein